MHSFKIFIIWVSNVYGIALFYIAALSFSLASLTLDNRMTIGKNYFSRDSESMI